MLLLTPSAQAEILEETTAATAEAVETVAPTEAGSALEAEPATEVATEVEEVAPEPTSAPVDAVKAVAEPLEKTVDTAGSAATPVKTTVSRVVETGPVPSGVASGSVAKVVSAVSKTVQSTPTGPVSNTVEAADTAVEGIGGRLRSASVPTAPQVAFPEPQGTHASLGAVASSPSAMSVRLIGGAAELLRAAPSDAPESARTATGGVGRGSEGSSHGPGPRPGSPAAVGSASGGTSFAPIVALLALLALVAPAIFRRPLRVPSSRAPAELACALERPG